MADPGSRFFFFFTSLIFSLSLLRHSITCQAQTLFVFGDGLYDVGNKQFLSSDPVPANAPPYGVTVGEATGRWSDGLLVPDYLANFLGIPRIAPILNTESDFSHGASFAVAGATVLGSPPETMTLGQQVMKLSENKNKWTDQERLEAIYLFYIGGDDYLDFAKTNPSPSDDQKQAFVDQVIAAIDAAIRGVYGAGGRKFAFQNLLPLGCLPAVKQEHGGEGDECVNLPSELAALHNTKLLQLLGNLARELRHLQYSYYDFFSAIQNRVSLPPTYTFAEGSVACCGTGAYNGNGCTTSTVCDKPQQYVFFDGMHLTQQANNQAGLLIWSADRGVISPINLKELLLLPLDAPIISGTASNTKESVKDTRSKIHNMYDMDSLEWGTENQWPYQIDGASSFIM